MKKFLLLFSTIAIAAVILSVGNKSQAENTENPFSLNLIYPQNQIEPGAGYFYIDLKADQSEELSIEVSNSTNKDIVVDIESADCFTAPQGGLIYVSNNTSENIGITDSGFMMADNIIPSVSLLSLKPYEKSTVSIKVNSPSVREGEVIGAVRFIDASAAGGDQPTSDTNIQVNIKRAMTIPIRVRLSQDQSPINPAISIGEVNFNKDEGNINLSLSNNLPAINRSAGITYEVFSASGESLFVNGFNLDKMAPKTSVKVPLKWIGNSVAPGKYTIKLTYPISDNRTEEVSREIEIDKAEASAIVTEALEPATTGPSNTSRLVYYGVVLFLLAVIIVLVVLLFRKKKQD